MKLSLFQMHYKFNKGIFMKPQIKRQLDLLTEAETKLKKSIEDLKKEKQFLFDRHFNECPEIKKAVEKLEGKEVFYEWLEDYILISIAVNFSELTDENREYFAAYLYEAHNFLLEKKEYKTIENSYYTLSYIDFSNYIIQDDGAVCNSQGDIVFEKDQYKNKDELHSLIEKDMEEKGEFTSVFECDHYGNLTLVNTQTKAA